MQDSFGKLERISIHGYKSIRRMDSLELNAINIIIGQNGAGKSNFISLFRLMAKLAREELRGFVIQQGGLRRILHYGPQTTKELYLRLKSDANIYSATLVPTADGDLVFLKETCSFLQTEKDIVVEAQTETQLRRTRRDGRIPPFIYEAIENWRVYHFHDTSENAPLRSAASLVEMESLAADGANLAAFLLFLQERHIDSFEMIVDAIRQVAPFVGGLVLRPEALNDDLVRLRWRHVGRDELFDVSDLSDGTLRFIALAALLMQPDPPPTIILDEPELGLHPAAIAHLAAIMHQITPDVQIIAATQSPAFANNFHWQDFVVVDRRDGASVFRRLTEEEVRPWMSEFAMGDIWDKNLIGGRP